VFCQENFEGSKTLKIQLQLTSQLSATRQLVIDRLLVFCQENFEGSKILKIQLQLTSQLSATRQLIIDRLLEEWWISWTNNC